MVTLPQIKNYRDHPFAIYSIWTINYPKASSYPKDAFRSLNFLLITTLILHHPEGDYVTDQEYLKPFLSPRQQKYFLTP